MNISIEEAFAQACGEPISRLKQVREKWESRGKIWSPVNFGKFTGRGKTTPWIVLHDPDWFFWANEQCAFPGNLYDQVQEAYYKARSIKIGGIGAKGLFVAYRVDYKTGLLRDVTPVRDPRVGGFRTPNTIYLDVLDLAVARHFMGYHKKGGTLLVRFLKEHCFGGPQARLTAKRCEAFFNDDENFDLDRDPVGELKRALQ